ncbi:MAG: hypothetical protein JSV86_16670 [Gemmatimonadota bacterium]|nr:MAG: hypothetical protein JSV86_16670 [Gemmatimonadota bacterium]
MIGVLSRNLTVSVLGLSLVVWAGCSDQDPITGPVFDDLSTASVRALSAMGYSSEGVPVQDLGTLGDGTWSEALAVNENGWVVGVGAISDWDYHAFLWTEDGGMQDITGAGWSFTRAEGVNKNGVVVGWGIKSGEGTRGFFWTEEGGMRSIGVPSGHKSSYCYNVNDAGEIIGAALSLSGSYNAIVWHSPTNLTVLGSLGGTASTALDINEEGRVAGKSALANTYNHAVLWIPQKSPVDLGTLGGAQSEALGINEISRVVGWAQNELAWQRPFIWPEEGEMVDLGTLGGNNGAAYEITDDGWAVGDSEDGSGEVRATLWKPDGTIVDLGTLGGLTAHARDINSHGLVVGFSDPSSGDRHATLWNLNGAGPPTPGDPVDEIKSIVNDLIDEGFLNRGLGNSLLVKVYNAEKHIEKGRAKTAANVLQAFINQVEAFINTGKLTLDDGLLLIELAEDVIDQLED